MKLWTIQSIERWERLQRDGVLRTNRVDPEGQCPGAYRFMRDQLALRVGAAPHENAWPIWAWYRWNPKSPRPDLRDVRHQCPKGERNVRIEFDVADERALLSCFGSWHIPLNCSGLFDSEELADAFDADLKRAGFTYVGWEELEQVLVHPELGPRMLKSWEKNFDLNWHVPDWTESVEEKQIQAVLWEVRKEDVRKVDFFVGAGVSDADKAAGK